MFGSKHLVECRCFLPQFKNALNPTNHKFVVFSVVDDNDVFQIKYVTCNNCGITHKVFDFCKSEIIKTSDASKASLSIDDIKLMVAEPIHSVLESYSVDLATWDQAKFIVEQQLWDVPIILTQELIDENMCGKLLRVLGPNRVKIEQYSVPAFIK